MVSEMEVSMARANLTLKSPTSQCNLSSVSSCGKSPKPLLFLLLADTCGGGD